MEQGRRGTYLDLQFPIGCAVPLGRLCTKLQPSFAWVLLCDITQRCPSEGSLQTRPQSRKLSCVVDGELWTLVSVGCVAYLSPMVPVCLCHHCTQGLHEGRRPLWSIARLTSQPGDGPLRPKRLVKAPGAVETEAYGDPQRQVSVVGGQGGGLTCLQGSPYASITTVPGAFARCLGLCGPSLG